MKKLLSTLYVLTPDSYLFCRNENICVKIGDAENSLQFYDGTPFVLKCGADVKICTSFHGGHEFTPQTDENGKLICTEDVWDITEYKQ